MNPRPDGAHRTLTEQWEPPAPALRKVLMSAAHMVILDEPTSVLAPPEVDALFAGLRHVRGTGLSQVIITHKLREARAIADRVTVLRGGKAVLSDAELTDLTDEELVSAMVGRTATALPAERVAVPAAGTPHSSSGATPSRSTVRSRPSPASTPWPAPVSWWAWRAWPATGSASCTR